MFSKVFLLATSFLSGIVLMSLEMIGFRVLAPYFGNSIYVWGNLIGVVLIAMSVGYFVGGKIADKRNSIQDLYIIILIAALYTLLVIFLYKSILTSLTALGALHGSFIAGIFLFAVPIFFLAMVSPCVITFISKNKHVGTSVGTVNFVSTIGNILGIYITTFFIIPDFGVRTSMIIAFVLLFLVAVSGLVKIKKAYAFLLLILLILFILPEQSLAENVILEEESLYNHVRLFNVSDNIYLVLNSDQAIQSVHFKGGNMTGYYFDSFTLLPAIQEKTETFLMLGMGGGTALKQFQEYYPDIKIDGVEIDQNVKDIAVTYFGIDDQEIDITVDDARTFLDYTEKTYDIIGIDIFQGSLSIPFYVLTREFFVNVDKVLNQEGIIMMNVFVPEGREEFSHVIENTLLSVFPSVYRIHVGTNTMLVATKQPSALHKQEITSNQKDVQNLITQIEIEPVQEHERLGIFTDDKAAVERYTKDLQ